MKLKGIIILVVGASLAGAAVWWTLDHHHRTTARAPASGGATALSRPVPDTVATGQTALVNSIGVIPASPQLPLAPPHVATGTFVATPAPPSPTVSANVLFVVKPPANTSYQARADAVHGLGRNLSAEDIAALAGYLRAPSRADSPNRELENWLRNDIMNNLVNQATVPDRLTGLLAGIYHDREQDAVMREYAVQHLPSAYTKLSATNQLLVRQTLWQAAGETGSSIAGAALLAMLAIVGPPPAGGVVESSTPKGGGAASDAVVETRAQLAQTALRIANNAGSGQFARITAISVCGRMGVSEALPVVTHLAQGAPTVPLQIAAIAALGDLGNQSAADFLKQLSHGTETRLRPAAASALRRLQQRTGI